MSSRRRQPWTPALLQDGGDMAGDDGHGSHGVFSHGDDRCSPVVSSVRAASTPTPGLLASSTVLAATASGRANEVLVIFSGNKMTTQRWRNV